MASRKKQDEKNLKTLRELAAISSNKYCFDCNQRGPTYVDVTIGSFVCTKCSGLLRGLTPPHRVKSISMATFTQDEIGLLESKGNEYCKKVWLGLFEGTPPTDSRDEQTIKEFMSEKYEKKRYYLDPSSQIVVNGRNGHTKNTATSPIASNGTEKITAPKNSNKMSSSSTEPKPILNNRYNSGNFQTTNRRRPETGANNFAHQQQQKPAAADSSNMAGDFVANFDTADIFSAVNNNNNINNNITGGENTLQQGFANFDNNPVFVNGTSGQNGLAASVVLPTQLNQQNNHFQNNVPMNVPPEDKYAALKDLDNALKSHSTLDWCSSGSNGSLYSSPTPTGSMYSSSSPQSSLFGSPSQGQFLNGFSNQETNCAISNPFGNNGFSWTNGKANGINCGLNGTSNGTHGFTIQNNYQNPFKMNGFSQMVTPGENMWTPNPFKVGATGTGSSNPFL